MIDPLIFPLSHKFAIREVVENLSFRSSGAWTFTNLIRILHSKGVRVLKKRYFVQLLQMVHCQLVRNYLPTCMI